MSASSFPSRSGPPIDSLSLQRFPTFRDSLSASTGSRVDNDLANLHDVETETLRLSKRLAELGWCSRREGDELIAAGRVFVDGVRVTQLGTKVTRDQHVELDQTGRAAQAARPTIILHKPIGIVSGQPEGAYHAAIELVTADRRWRDDPNTTAFAPRQRRDMAVAGRLDVDSTGLLILTANGTLARSIIDGSGGVEKEYLVRIEGRLSPNGLQRLRHGLELDGRQLRPAEVTWSGDQRLRFILREGRNRQIRRMCELVGIRVTALKRIRIGAIELGALPSGQWRLLGPDEHPNGHQRQG
jgi:23S rRNA pseudouridine2604 synthase